MKIYLSIRYGDGTDNVNVIFHREMFEKVPCDFLKWLSVMDVWNYGGKPYKADKYELPSEMKNYLFSYCFDILVERFFGRKIEIIRN